MKVLKTIGLAALGATMLAGAAYAQDYTIGVSNTVQGNGWREEMICAIKAQALASGKVAKLNIAHRNTDAAGQLEDLRNLISAKVDAIVVNPADPAGIQAALKEATDAGKAQLKEAADPSLSPEWPVSISINDWTTYTKDQIVACKGPGE